MKRLALAALLGLACWAGPAGADDDAELAQAGSEVPLYFRLPAYNPEMKGLVGLRTIVGEDREDPKTRLLVLSFMASYCKPCKKELPFLESLYEKYKDRGLRVVMVSVDTDEAAFPVMTALVKEHHVTFPVLKDRLNLVSRSFLGSKTPLPSLFLVGPDGVVLQVKRGYTEDASRALQADVEKALGITAK